MSAEEALALSKHVDWGPNLPTSEEEIDYSDIPAQDWSGPDIVRGRYRELALAAQGFVQLDSAIRSAFPDTQAVNKALRDLLRKRQRKTS